MVMIHKFLDENNVSAQSLFDTGTVPKFEKFEIIYKSDRILLLIDEAHRTQGGDMGDNLFTAFPHAARIGFTGTPLLTERREIKPTNGLVALLIFIRSKKMLLLGLQLK